MTGNSLGEFYFQWHITQRCNLRCRHCYHDSYDGANELTPDQLTLVFHRLEGALRQWQRPGSASLTGGEPFIRREDLFRLAELMDRSDWFTYYDVLTNGSLLSGGDLQRLDRLSKLRRVQLSLESPYREVNDVIRGTGSFDTTVSAIRELKGHGFQVSVMMTASKLNNDHVPEMIRFLEDEGVDAFAVERFVPEGSGAEVRELVLSRDDAAALFKTVHAFGTGTRRIRVLMHRPLFCLIDAEDSTVGAMCSVGTNALTIMHDGTLYPCRRLPIPIGNVLTDGVFKAWYDSDVLWSVRNPSNLKGKCGACELAPLCRGCRAMAYCITGDYLEEDPHCWKHADMSTN
ncbi:MAG: radical SAM protein [Firmicutes bacterium]|nr:radical SAM protein [Bacillota bacterium]